MAVGDPDKRVKERAKGSFLILGAGSWLTSMTVSGFLLGYGLDAWLDSEPVFMLIFGLFGFMGGILRIHKMLSSLS